MGFIFFYVLLHNGISGSAEKTHEDGPKQRWISDFNPQFLMVKEIVSQLLGPSLCYRIFSLDFLPSALLDSIQYWRREVSAKKRLAFLAPRCVVGLRFFLRPSLFW